MLFQLKHKPNRTITETSETLFSVAITIHIIESSKEVCAARCSKPIWYRNDVEKTVPFTFKDSIFLVHHAVPSFTRKASLIFSWNFVVRGDTQVITTGKWYQLITDILWKQVDNCTIQIFSQIAENVSVSVLSHRHSWHDIHFRTRWEDGLYKTTCRHLSYKQLLQKCGLDLSAQKKSHRPICMEQNHGIVLQRNPFW